MERLFDMDEKSEESITQLRESKREVDEIDEDVLSIVLVVLFSLRGRRQIGSVYAEDGALEESICSCMYECRELKKECIIYIHALTTK